MKYLVFNTETEALSRTSQEAEARGCIGTTRFWWGLDKQKLANGLYVYQMMIKALLRTQKNLN